nr:hypothetical protein [uncultured Sellimonas sp.]
MVKKQRKIKVFLMFLCSFCILTFSGCSSDRQKVNETQTGNDNIYVLQGREIQINLPQEFEYTRKSDNKIFFEGRSGEVQLEYIEGRDSVFQEIPKTEDECVEMYSDFIGAGVNQVEDFQSFYDDGVYYALIRSDDMGETKYLITSGNFTMNDGWKVTAFLHTSDRKKAEQMKDIIYNVKIFKE